jgi:hypothetical protein
MRSLVLLAGYAAAAVRDADPLVKTPVSQDRDATKDIVLQTERPVPLDAKGCCVPSHDVSSAGNVGLAAQAAIDHCHDVGLGNSLMAARSCINDKGCDWSADCDSCCRPREFEGRPAWPAGLECSDATVAKGCNNEFCIWSEQCSDPVDDCWTKWMSR